MPSLLKFFLLTYAITETCFISVVALSGNAAHPGLSALLLAGVQFRVTWKIGHGARQ